MSRSQKTTNVVCSGPRAEAADADAGGVAAFYKTRSDVWKITGFESNITKRAHTPKD